MEKTEPNPNKLLSVSEAAALLGLAKITIYTWCSQKRIPYVKLGKRVFFRTRDLEAHLDANTVLPRQQAPAH